MAEFVLKANDFDNSNHLLNLMVKLKTMSLTKYQGEKENIRC